MICEGELGSSYFYRRDCSDHAPLFLDLADTVLEGLLRGQLLSFALDGFGISRSLVAGHQERSHLRERAITTTVRRVSMSTVWRLNGAWISMFCFLLFSAMCV